MKTFLTKILFVESWDIAKQVLINALTNLLLNFLMMLMVWGFFAYQVHKITQEFHQAVSSVSIKVDATKEAVNETYDATKEYTVDKATKLLKLIGKD